MLLSKNELERYSRQIVLDAIGLEGQKTLKDSRVGIIGAGGLGCFSSIQLAAIGVGFLRIFDQDVVDITNLHRQILYDVKSIGVPKVEVAQKRLVALNPNLEVEALTLTINEDTADEAVKGLDLVVDGLDRFSPRYAVNRACVKQGVPYIFAGALGTYGNVSTIIPGKTACFECFAGNMGDEGTPTCETVGVLPSILAIITGIQVTEALHVLLGREPSLTNKILFCDIFSLTFSKIDIVQREDCPVCGIESNQTPRINSSTQEVKVVELCGGDSFMASPQHPLQLDLVEVSKILEKHFTVKLRSDFGVSFSLSSGATMNLMKTGNAVIKGVPKREIAVKLYNQVLTLLDQ